MSDDIVRHSDNSDVAAVFVAVTAGVLAFLSFSGVTRGGEVALTTIAFFLLILAASYATARVALSIRPKRNRDSGDVSDVSVLLRILFLGLIISSLLVWALACYLEIAAAKLSQTPGVSVLQHTLEHKMELSRQSDAGENSRLFETKLDCVIRDLEDPADPDSKKPEPKTTCYEAEGYFAREFLAQFISENGGTYFTEDVKRRFVKSFLQKFINPSNELSGVASSGSGNDPFNQRTVEQEICLVVLKSGKDHLNRKVAEGSTDSCTQEAGRILADRFLSRPNFNPISGVHFRSLNQLLTRDGVLGDQPESPNETFIFGSDFGFDSNGSKIPGFDAAKVEFQKYNELLEAINRGYREMLAGNTKAGNLLLGWVQWILYYLFVVGMAQLYVVHLAQKAGSDGEHRARGSDESTMDYISNVRLAFAGYIDANIPRLGFIGTVLGISAALAEAYRIVDPGLTPVGQADQIQVVVGLLGIAFNTTFVALVLGVIFDIFYRIIVSRELTAARPGADS